MNRLHINAADPPIVHGETLLLVRDPYPGWAIDSAAAAFDPYGPMPSEFVLVSASCKTCNGTREHHYEWGGKAGTADPCHDCRIELVGPCPDCGGSGNVVAVRGGGFVCRTCNPSTHTVTLGHAYAGGDPMQQPDGSWSLSLRVVSHG